MTQEGFFSYCLVLKTRVYLAKIQLYLDLETFNYLVKIMSKCESACGTISPYYSSSTMKRGFTVNIIILALFDFFYIANSPGAQGGPVCKICPLILTLDPYWGP